MKPIHLLSILSCCLGLSSCFNPGIIQTAKPTPVGEKQITIGGYGSHMFGEYFGGGNIMVRRGISSRSDWGWSYSLGFPGHLSADLKYALYMNKDQTTYLSSGLVLDVYFGERYTPNLYISTIPGQSGIGLPFYFSMNHDGLITPYISQKVTMGLKNRRSLSTYSRSPEKLPSDWSYSWFYSGGLGVQIGRGTTRFFMEYSYYLQQRSGIDNQYTRPDPNGPILKTTRKTREQFPGQQLTIGITFRRNR